MKRKKCRGCSDAECIPSKARFGAVIQSEASPTQSEETDETDEEKARGLQVDDIKRRICWSVFSIETAGGASPLPHLPCLHYIAPRVGATATACAFEVSSFLFLSLVDLSDRFCCCCAGTLLCWLLIPVLESQVKRTAKGERLARCLYS